MKRKNLFLIILLIILSLSAYYKKRSNTDDFFPTGQLEIAYDEKRSDIQVTGTGEIVKLLPDDNEGSRHQKMIVKIASNHTILISHNISLAPRADVKEGDIITFHGEYEWNKKGGVVHWTHHDPQKKHPDGWLEVNGQRYR